MGDGLTARLISLCNHGSHLTLQICSTLSDWEHITERFRNATHYSEKALYKLLKNHIAPVVVADLRVGETPIVCPFVLVLLKLCLGN